MKSFNVPPESMDRNTQSLIDYVSDIKPYHSKLIEITEESVFQEKARIRFIENLKIEES